LFHFLSILTFGAKLEQSVNSFSRRLDAIESGRESTEAVQVSQSLSQLKKITEKCFSDVVKQVEQLEQSQARQLKSNDKNLVHRVDEMQGKVRLLEDKNARQLVEIKTLQTQITHLHTTKSVATWDTVSTTPLKHSSGNLELARLGNLEKRYEDMERQVTRLKVHVSEMELQLQASLASTYNGSFMWRIPDLAKRKRDAIDGRITSLYSPPFYTAKNGYKMCIRIYLNGDGMGHKTHLSVFFVLMKGEFDALLKWPFDNKVSLILVDQNHRKHLVQTFKPTPESSSFQRPISDMNVASGCPQFCKLSVLDDDSYTKDDVLFIKCIVDTSHIFHP
jgi:TNF receptor-associated factor 2/TNF receptor-associated factor 3